MLTEIDKQLEKLINSLSVALASRSVIIDFFLEKFEREESDIMKLFEKQV